MTARKSIPKDVRQQVIAIVDQFNEANSSPPSVNPIHAFLLKLRGPSADGKKPRYRVGELFPGSKESFYIWIGLVLTNK